MVTSHKPTSVRNKPGYIKAASEQYFRSLRVQEKDLEIGKFLEDLVCWVYVYTCSLFNINLLHRLPGGGGGSDGSAEVLSAVSR